MDTELKGEHVLLFTQRRVARDATQARRHAGPVATSLNISCPAVPGRWVATTSTSPTHHSCPRVSGGVLLRALSTSHCSLCSFVPCTSDYVSDPCPCPAVEAFDPRLNAWVPKASMQQARAYGAAAYADGALWVIGGMQADGYQYNRSFER